MIKSKVDLVIRMQNTGAVLQHAGTEIQLLSEIRRAAKVHMQTTQYKQPRHNIHQQLMSHISNAKNSFFKDYMTTCLIVVTLFKKHCRFSVRVCQPTV